MHNTKDFLSDPSKIQAGSYDTDTSYKSLMKWHSVVLKMWGITTFLNIGTIT